jgi:hypothetical protein
MGSATEAEGHATGDLQAMGGEYDAAEEMLDAQLVVAAAGLMKRI